MPASRLSHKVFYRSPHTSALLLRKLRGLGPANLEEDMVGAGRQKMAQQAKENKISQTQ
jgi:hypothetical protein